MEFAKQAVHKTCGRGHGPYLIDDVSARSADYKVIITVRFPGCGRLRRIEDLIFPFIQATSQDMDPAETLCLEKKPSLCRMNAALRVENHLLVAGQAIIRGLRQRDIFGIQRSAVRG